VEISYITVTDWHSAILTASWRSQTMKKPDNGKVKQWKSQTMEKSDYSFHEAAIQISNIQKDYILVGLSIES